MGTPPFILPLPDLSPKQHSAPVRIAFYAYEVKYPTSEVWEFQFVTWLIKVCSPKHVKELETCVVSRVNTFHHLEFSPQG